MGTPKVTAAAVTALAAFAVASGVAAGPGCLCLRAEGGSPNAPEADLDVEPLTVLPGVRVFADATSSSDEDGAPGGFCFSFGDYPRSPTVRNTSGLASYTFVDPGEYDVRVVVFDDACPVPLLLFDESCAVENEQELVNRNVRCTRDIATARVTVLVPPESGVSDSGAGDTDSGPPLCFDDTLEPNDTIDTSTPAGTGTLTALTICDKDVDFFAYDLAFGARISVTLTLTPTAGDIDAVLIDPEGMFVAVASEDAQVETIEFDVLTPGLHHLEVYGFGGQRGGYDMVTSVSF